MLAFVMCISHFIGFLLSITLVLITSTNVGICSAKNEMLSPLNDGFASPVNTRTPTKKSQITMKNKP